MAMVKTFHQINKYPQFAKNNKSTDNEKVKTFNDVQAKPAINSEQKKPVESVNPKGATIVFKYHVHVMNGDISLIDDGWVGITDTIVSQYLPEFEIQNNEYLLARNIFQALELFDSVYQIEFGSEYSQRFQSVQAFMSDYVKVSKVTDITRLCDLVINIAKGIDIHIFDPSKISTKISRLLNTRKQKVTLLRKQFDYACDQIDERLDHAQAELKEMRDQLEQFRAVIQDLKKLDRDIHLALIAIYAQINTADVRGELTSQSVWEQISDQEKQRTIERWKRKIANLQALLQSIQLTVPQVELYEQNFVNGYESIEDIKVNLIQVWKQQFMTVIAVEESSDISLFFDLQQAQDSFMNGIKEHHSHVI